MSNIIVETLKVNFTKKSKSAMTGDQLGAENFANWVTAVENCRREFYKYECAKHKAAGMGKDATVDASGAFNALQTVLNIIGEVNGHAIAKNQSMLDVLSVCTLNKTKPLAGEALTIKSQLDNAKKRLEALSYNGVNPEAVEACEAEITRLEEELRIAKRETGSCAPMTSCVKDKVFRTKFEEEFCKTVILKQEAKSWEELEAEEEARRIARNERAKARKAAKKAAKAQTPAA